MNKEFCEICCGNRDQQAATLVHDILYMKLNNWIVCRMSSFVFPKNQPVVQLDCEKAFQALNTEEKLYAHYLSQAAWYGGLIVLVQVSILQASGSLKNNNAA